MDSPVSGAVTKHLRSRREFLRRAAGVSVAGAAAPWALNLAAIGEAAAQSALSDYKALVCVFLNGGNDHSNTVVPYDTTNHALYATLRGSLALQRSALAATALAPLAPPAGGQQYALAPALAPLLPIFDAGRLGVLLNVGPLVQPTTKAQYTARSVPLPPRLFSHNDQQSTWQASTPEGATSGWGGRMGDLLAAGNGEATFTCISVSGNAVFLSGRSAVQYQMSSSGSVPINGAGATLYGSAAAAQGLRTLITSAAGPSLLEQEHARLVTRSIAANTTVTSALGGAAALATVFPATGLGSQLKMVARMLSARGTFGAKRQVFFVSMGGFDTHDGLLDDHPLLMAQLGGALAAFDTAMGELGISNQVTTFTASDFGRTLTSNGDGSDHGWGAHHFVMGGAVRGQRLHGLPPLPANNGADDVGQGRLLPTTSVDQLGATLATWFGVSDANLPLVMPGIGNYTMKDIGLFQA
jgi:uncharacterized protein (DUF1501 family)